MDLGEGSTLQRLSVGGWRAVAAPGAPLATPALADLAVDAPAPRPMLLQTWPNPFNAALRVAYEVSGGGPLVIAVYDTRGRHVATLLDEAAPPGRGEPTWNGRDSAEKAVASGSYVVRAGGAGGWSVRRVTLVQ